MNNKEINENCTNEESYIEVSGKKIYKKISSYFNRYYLRNNDIFITDYVDECGNIKYQKVEVKKGKPIFLREEKVKSCIDN